MRLIIITFFIIIFLSVGGLVNAQTIDSSLWQTGAVGLKTQNQADKKTAGLGFMVEQQSWPFIIQRGGVTSGESLSGPSDIRLGQVSVPGATASFTSETADWAYDEMTYTYGGSNLLKLTSSRLSPAILVQASANKVNFLNSLNPKYIAYSSGGNIQVKTLSTTLQNLSLDKNWILIWYGNGSNFSDTKRPLFCVGLSWDPGCHVSSSEQFTTDIPILFIFQNNPTSVRLASPGVEINFSSSMGFSSFMPLFGRNNLRSSETETWASGLPSAVLSKINFWSTHLCSYPKTVSETYSYNKSTDTTSIVENVNFQTVCSGGTTFALLPPMLALAKDSLGVTFSHNVVNGNLPTEFGPVWGVENTTSYSWEVKGLTKYVDSKRVFGLGQAPSDLISLLDEQVNKVIAGNHWAPWLFVDSIPRHVTRGELYWVNPADTINNLAEVVQALPDNSSVKINLINYLKTERTNYPPENIYDLPLTEFSDGSGKILGTVRNNYSTYESDWAYTWVKGCDGNCDVGRLKQLPLSNLYSLSQYYDLPGVEVLSNTVYTKAKTVLNNTMKEQDWASFYWFKNNDLRRIAVWNVNEHFSGIVGFIRLAEKLGDTANEQLGRALLAKAAVLKIGTALYPKYLYPSGLIEVPSDPLWFVKNGYGYGFYNISWSGVQDDARQVATFDQFYVRLEHFSGFVDGTAGWETSVCSPYLIAYRGLTPELGRLLSDKIPNESLIYQNKVSELFPHWYQAFAEGTLGGEHGLNHPIDSFQMFLAKSWIQKDVPANLELYSDIPWLTEGGDLFYMQKLAEAIKAYKGISWSDQSGVPTPTPACGLAGDVDCSGQVNAIDLSKLILKFGQTYSGREDVDGSGQVNAIDLAILLSHFGQ
jgi:hypothetical protein